MKKMILPLAILLLVVALLTQTELGSVLGTGDLNRIAQYIQEFGFWTIVVSIMITILQTFFPFVPYFLIAGVNVVIFGSIGGFVLTWLSAVMGAVLSFYLSRYIAHDYAQKKVGSSPFFSKLNAQAERSGFRIILMARLIPIIPSGIINSAAGLSRINITHFFVATLLGKLPITILEAIMGHDLLNFHDHKLRFVLVMALLGLLMWAGSALGKRAEQRVTAVPAGISPHTQTSFSSPIHGQENSKDDF
ncbi:TVP38/TMEM64 family protein [Brevibacillus daliensis]|uniref:TVP38/TMEM64 family protein n=1 Tax=Brevibacillus daliensis TaxID=2892995 RepID=UPI001E3D49E2|nr:TVP38/TMEM64 family protein [Brevibacillus daliensis]